MLSQKLHGYGFNNALVYTDGFPDWEKRGLPVEKGAAAMMRLVASPWFSIRVQLALGALFVAAAIPKILDPPSFAHMIYNYRLLPGVRSTRWRSCCPGWSSWPDSR